MVEIRPLTGADRAGWEVLARAYHAMFDTEVSDGGYTQTWRRLLDGEQIRGIAARLDGKLIGFAHYYFHTSVWSAGDCRAYLQDLFVDAGARGCGAGRALYDKVASYRGFIAYARRLEPRAGAA